MRVTSYCSKCMKGTEVALPSAEVVCRCGERRAVAAPAGEALEQCALCGCGYLYVEKDFPSWLGGAIMLAGVVGFLVMTFHDIAVALGILLGVAALDWVVYQVRPFRTICYGCLATYRGAGRNPAHRAYELGLAGRFTDDYEEQRRRHS